MVGSQPAEKSQIRQEERTAILNQCLAFEFVSSRRLIVGTRTLLRWSLDLQDRVHSGLPSPSASSGSWSLQRHRLAGHNHCSVRRCPPTHLESAGGSPCLYGLEDNLPPPGVLRTPVLLRETGGETGRFAQNSQRRARLSVRVLSLRANRSSSYSGQSAESSYCQQRVHLCSDIPARN